MTAFWYRSAALDARTRAVPLDDISIDKGGDGRTVTAYATVFDTAAEIRDQDGHYDEQISRSAFEKTLRERAGRVGVFYNHARTIHGTPSERYSMPLGVPVEIKPDGRGLLTRTRYNKTPLADEVLASIENGDIRGQSFTGRMITSDPQRGPFRSRAGSRTLVTRKEIALLEYGPTPFPAYPTAEIVGVRSLVDRLHALGAVDIDELSDDELIAAVRGNSLDDSVVDEATTPDEGAGAGDPAADSGDQSSPVLRAQQVRARLRKIGLL